jgi:hypothetical protein
MQTSAEMTPGEVVRPKTNGLAITSMILGIIWVYWLGSILAVIFGHIALSQIKRFGQRGRGMAIAGLILGYLGVATLAATIIIVIVDGDSTGGAYFG